MGNKVFIYRVFAVLIFAVFYSLISFSQSDSSSNTLLIEKLDVEDLKYGQQPKSIEVISASRSSKNLEDLPITVYVISSEEILNNGYSTLVDVLKNIPGIRVSQPGSAIEGETFLMRGLFGNYYTKILINNLPIQPSAVSGMPLGAQLPIKQAERIEITVGPASAIYGADAMAGVINIITKDPDQTIYAQADMGSGQFGYNQLNLLLGGKLGKDKNILKYSFYGSNTERQDWNIKYKNDSLFNPLSYTNDTSYRSHPYYEGNDTMPVLGELPHKSRLLGMQLKYRGLRASFDNMYRKDHSAIGLSPLISSYSNPNRFHAETLNRFTFGYDKNIGRLSITSNVSYLKYKMDKRSSFVSISDWTGTGLHHKYSASDDVYIEQLATFHAGKNLEILSGVSFQYSGNLPVNNYLQAPFDESLYKPFSTAKIAVASDLSDNMYPLVFNNLGTFLQFYYANDKLNLVGGCRIDNHSSYGTSINPRMAASYKITKNYILRSSFSTAFRGPSSYYTYNSIALPNDRTGYKQWPNFDLKPERLYSYELGNKIIFSPYFSIDISAFYQHISNLINNSFVFDTVALHSSVLSNIITLGYFNDKTSTGTLFGCQGVLNITNLLPAIKLNIDAYSSFSKGKEVLPFNHGVLNNYRMVPKFMEQINISFYPLPKLYMSIRYLFMTEYLDRSVFSDPLKNNEVHTFTAPGFYTFDLTTRFQISNNFYLFAKVINLLDAQYGGLDVSGNINSALEFNDLLYNPQLKRNIQFGVSFKMN